MVSRNVAQLVMAEAAADRKRHTGLGPSPANLLSWERAIAAPGSGFLFYAVEVNYLTGVAMAGGGDGVTGPRLWLRAGVGRAFIEITARLPADATGDIQEVTAAGSTSSWWVCGVDQAGTGGWLAYTGDDGATWSSWTVAAGITQPLRGLHTLAGVILWVCGDNAFLKVWQAPATWTNLSPFLAAIGWTEDVRCMSSSDGVNLMIGGGDLPVTAQACAYSANGGLTWTDRTVALGAVLPLYDVTAYPGQWVVCGGDVLKRSGDNGANWDDWLTPTLQLALPFYNIATLLSELLISTTLGPYMLFDGGFVETPLPVKVLEVVRGMALTHSEIFVCGSDVWVTTQGGAVVAYMPFITETRPSPAKWVEVAGSSPVVAHYGRVRMTALLATATVACTVTVYDNTAASGTGFIWNVPANVPIVFTPLHPLQMKTGITVALSAPATTNVLVSWIG